MTRARARAEQPLLTPKEHRQLTAQCKAASDDPLAKRLLARRGERVSVDDIRTIAADVLRGMRTQ